MNPPGQLSTEALHTATLLIYMSVDVSRNVKLPFLTTRCQ